MKNIFVMIHRSLALVLALVCLSSALAESAVITQDTFVFQSPSVSSAHVKAGRGTAVELVAVKGPWAMVKKGGMTAYMNAAHVSAKKEESRWDPDLSKKTPAIMVEGARIYRAPSKDSASVKLNAGTRLNLIVVNGSWAMVENGGVIAYAPASAVASLASLKSKAASATLRCGARIYREMNVRSASAAVPAGTVLNVLAIFGGAALVEKGGYYAYIALTALTCGREEEPAQAQAAAAPAASAPAAAAASTAAVSTFARTAAVNYFASSSYSNEEKCFLFLTREMKLNTAAACGVLSNAKRESSFRTTCTTGKYYGLFQWGDQRLKNMKEFCKSLGLPNDSLEGQLKFMQHEVETWSRYTELLKILRTTPNTAQGAFNAAYQFCYIYERPGNIEASSTRRGNVAKDTFFPKYNK